MNQTNLLTTKEAAKYLHCAEITLHVWRFKRIGPNYIKQGKYIRYLKEELDEFISSNTINTQKKRSS